ncbi:hypothetical protein MATL_G00160890 [Megalops atlanticus]|uniref:TOG domain-containing protein n=1 Tax=Megalops atlanticus TaxID=7932 RepID=A0A9D3PR03_MEGAT|nr:hypothetical protein MATL_G00160890 [Megalops atlanticus]
MRIPDHQTGSRQTKQQTSASFQAKERSQERAYPDLSKGTSTGVGCSPPKQLPTQSATSRPQLCSQPVPSVGLSRVDQGRTRGNEDQLDLVRDQEDSPEEILAALRSKVIAFHTESAKEPPVLSRSTLEKARERWSVEIERVKRERERRNEFGERGEKGSDPEQSTSVLSVPKENNRINRELALRRRMSFSHQGAHRSSLPSISTTNQRRRNSCVPPGFTLQPDLQEEEWGGDSAEEKPRPFSQPELRLSQALRDLRSQDWKVRWEGLSILYTLAICHPDTLQAQLHQASEMVTQEVLSLRSGVSRAAMQTLGAMCRGLKGIVDGELESVIRVLLLKVGDTNEFLREEAQEALRTAVETATPTRALATLIATGAAHRNPASRCSAAEMMLSILEREGAERVLGGTRAEQEQLIQTVVTLAQDCQQDTRFYGRHMLSILMSHPKCDDLTQQCLTSHDLHFLSSAQQKAGGDVEMEFLQPQGRRASRVSSSVRTVARGQTNRGKALGATGAMQAHPSSGRMSVGGTEQELRQRQGMERGCLHEAAARPLQKEARLEELQTLLSAIEHTERSRGVTLLLELSVQHTPLIAGNISMVWEWFRPCLQDPNRKLCLLAHSAATLIASLLGNSLSPILSSLVTEATDILSAEQPGITHFAVTLLDCLIAHCGLSITPSVIQLTI